MEDYQCPTWNNSNIYKNINDERIDEDINRIGELLDQFERNCSIFSDVIENVEELAPDEINYYIECAQILSRDRLDISMDLSTLSVFASCVLSVDAQNSKAKEIESKVSDLHGHLGQSRKPLDLFLLRCNERVLSRFLEDESIKELKFHINHRRLDRDFLLNVGEEKLIAALENDGLHSWGKLYDELSGIIRCQVREDDMGLAQVSSLLRQSDMEMRKEAYLAINKGWGGHQESVAAILNSINGWRIQSAKLRSKKRELHYLDDTCRYSFITRKTLNALMDSTYSKRHLGRRALDAQAKIMGMEKLGPWDLLAPAPVKDGSGTKISFPEAIEMVSAAFNKLSSEMGEFPKMMYQNGWIDAQETPYRRPGAYCTKFANRREPRVFMTYGGTIKDILTLAHELGHAYHNWVMRDMPLTETMYPSTLAETASIFAETLMRDDLYSKCSTHEERLAMAWQDASSAETFLLNIPARFEFEKMLVDNRVSVNLPAERLKEMTKDAWRKWYGDSLCQYNEMFWASKLHFSISTRSFYNYPYLFGYLFALGVYAKRENYQTQDSNEFHKVFVNLLRDTGSMHVEDLVKKHLGVDISDEKFWLDSLEIVEREVSRFERLAGGEN
jgi:oligoendopeptidase F